MGKTVEEIGRQRFRGRQRIRGRQRLRGRQREVERIENNKIEGVNRFLD